MDRTKNVDFALVVDALSTGIDSQLIDGFLDDDQLLPVAMDELKHATTRVAKERPMLEPSGDSKAKERSTDEPQPEVELDDEDVEAIRRARAPIRAGRKVPMDLLFKLLPEYRARIS